MRELRKRMFILLSDFRNMDVAKRDDEIVKFNKKIADLNAKLQKYEDKQSAKQDASKQNSTKKSLFGRKK